MTRNTDCRDLRLDEQGCIAIGRLVLDIMRTPLPDRLNEPGTCEICKRPLGYAWRVVSQANPEKFWEFAVDSDEAAKCNQKEFDTEKFQYYPNYYCPNVLDRWATIFSEDSIEQLSSVYVKGDREVRKVWIREGVKLSPVDIAEALQKKQEFDALNELVLVHSATEKKKAPMDLVGAQGGWQ